MHWRYCLNWWWNVCNLSAKLDYRKLMKINSLKYNKRKFLSLSRTHVCVLCSKTQKTDEANALASIVNNRFYILFTSGRTTKLSKRIRFFRPKQVTYIGLFCSALTDWSFLRLICFIVINWPYHATFLFSLPSGITIVMLPQLCWPSNRIMGMMADHPLSTLYI